MCSVGFIQNIYQIYTLSNWERNSMWVGELTSLDLYSVRINRLANAILSHLHKQRERDTYTHTHTHTHKQRPHLHINCESQKWWIFIQAIAWSSIVHRMCTAIVNVTHYDAHFATDKISSVNHWDQLHHMGSVNLVNGSFLWITNNSA